MFSYLQYQRVKAKLEEALKKLKESNEIMITCDKLKPRQKQYLKQRVESLQNRCTELQEQISGINVE